MGGVPGVRTVALTSRLPFGVWGLLRVPVRQPETPVPEVEADRVELERSIV